MTTPPSDGAAPAPLPRRPPKPLLVHMGICAAVAFLLSALVFWIIGLPFWVTILFSVGVGIGAGPYMRRAEIEALAKRPDPQAGET